MLFKNFFTFTSPRPPLVVSNVMSFLYDTRTLPEAAKASGRCAWISHLFIQVGQVVDDVGVLRGDLGIGAVIDQLLHRVLDGVAQLLITGTEGNAVLLRAQLLAEDGEAAVFLRIVGGDRLVDDHGVNGAAAQLGEALEEAVAGGELAEGLGQALQTDCLALSSIA